MSIGKFLAYNNTVPIVLGVLFLSSGLVFAANEEVRGFIADSVYQAAESVVSIDNSYIANKNLDTYSPKVAIQNVTEDEDFYYVTYIFTTIALDDSVWKDVAQEKVMQVAKTALGDYVDLGVYVTEQLKQLVERELAFLREVQGIERKNVTSKVVATAYSGLVGQFIDEHTVSLPGYIPVVVTASGGEQTDPVAIAKAQKDDVVTPPAPNPNNNNQQNNSNQNSGNSNNSSGSTTTNGPVITLLGANPARVTLNSGYSDLGVVTTSQEGVTLDLSIIYTLNGKSVSSISIDTTKVGDWSVGYSATDRDGNTSFKERVVIVYDPNAPEEDEEEETATTTATTTPTSTPATSTQNTEVVEEEPQEEPQEETPVSSPETSEEEEPEQTSSTSTATSTEPA